MKQGKTKKERETHCHNIATTHSVCSSSCKDLVADRLTVLGRTSKTHFLRTAAELLPQRYTCAGDTSDAAQRKALKHTDG
jgi:hypothetical protein